MLLFEDMNWTYKTTAREGKEKKWTRSETSQANCSCKSEMVEQVEDTEFRPYFYTKIGGRKTPPPKSPHSAPANLSRPSSGQLTRRTYVCKKQGEKTAAVRALARRELGTALGGW